MINEHKYTNLSIIIEELDKMTYWKNQGGGPRAHALLQRLLELAIWYISVPFVVMQSLSHSVFLHGPPMLL